MSEIIDHPEIETKSKPKVDFKLQPEVESQVTVHCTVKGDGSPFCAIRVWKSTFLVDAGTSHQSKLLHAEGIVFQPQWQMIPLSGVARFTLIFSALPKSCKQFNFEEVIPEAGAWSIKNIKRNEMDVYNIELT